MVCSADKGCSLPPPAGLNAQEPQHGTKDQVALKVERGVDGGMKADKALGGSR
jgi:hypothetical protein